MTNYRKHKGNEDIRSGRERNVVDVQRDQKKTPGKIRNSKKKKKKNEKERPSRQDGRNEGTK